MRRSASVYRPVALVNSYARFSGYTVIIIYAMLRVTLFNIAALALPFVASLPSENLVRGVGGSCGVNGYDRGEPIAYSYSTKSSLASKDRCGARCVADPECKSFAFSYKSCLLYVSTV